MQKKYLVSILSVMAFTSFVAYATVQTKSLAQQSDEENVVQVPQSESLPVLSPEVLSANTPIEIVEPSVNLDRSQRDSVEKLVTPASIPLVKETQVPTIVSLPPIHFGGDDEPDFENEDSEDSRYEQNEDEEDD